LKNRKEKNNKRRKWKEERKKETNYCRLLSKELNNNRSISSNLCKIIITKEKKRKTKEIFSNRIN